MKKALKIPKSKEFSCASKALDYINQLYTQQVEFLRGIFDDFSNSQQPNDFSKQGVHGYYPYVRFAIQVADINPQSNDSRHSYGFVTKPGIYETTVTRPDIFQDYYYKQLDLLISNHQCAVEIGISNQVIPIHFALGEDFHLEGDLSKEHLELLPKIFDQPDLYIMDDQIANNTYRLERRANAEETVRPLSLFPAMRSDLSLMRLKHYTGTKAEHFQNFVIFTNYQFYIDEFVKIGTESIGQEGYTEFVQPDTQARLPQMPAYHLKREGKAGITMINIGVGPSNAKTITDHIAVLRPHAWFMLGHCAGLRNSQELGDYVLAHGYLREDNVLNEDLHPSIPIPALAEVQLALEQAVADITCNEGYDVKKVMRTGTVATVDDRNWELRPSAEHSQKLSQSRAVALDMESGTIAANGYRFRVPYGTLLCVSDKPLHGQLKLPGMADSFYRQRVKQHLFVGIRAMEILRDIPPARLHSRKLRAFNEVAFR